MRFLPFVIVAALVGCAGNTPQPEPVLPEPNAALSIFGEPVFNGATGEQGDWNALFAAMDEADIVIFAESHADARGHAMQREMIVLAGQRWDDFTLSLEEFDRRQQPDLDAYSRGDASREDLRDVRPFVDPRVRENWFAWYYPKISAARDGDASLLASNAPLKYSRLVRNVGCDNLPELAPEERATFECPAVTPAPEYRARFDKRMQRVARQNRQTGLKELQPEQLDHMFEAHRVWDATMADSIAKSRADGQGQIIHVVGGFHVDFTGGLIQELNYRDPDARILVISFIPRRSDTLREIDRDRADWIIYTRS